MSGLRIYAKADGTWLEFKASNGCSSVLRIETLADERRGIIGKALAQWCQDRQAETVHICTRCGERVENGIEQDGCRDLDCPEQQQDRTG